MPAFTAAAAAVVGWLGGAAVFGAATAFVTAALATGIAMVTSRILNPTPKGGQGGSASTTQGTRIQLPPGTDNKVPVLYGRAYCNPIIVDAYISTSDGKTQDTMTYIMLLSETSAWSDATYTVNDIYWNDLRLEFSAGAAQRGKKRNEAAYNEPEDFVDENFKDRVWFGVWRWNNATRSVDTIFGDKTIQQFVPDGQVTSASKYEGYVFAAMTMRYDQEKGFTGLSTMTFDMTNSISDPAKVLYDYMTSSRYGAGMNYDEFDIPSLQAWSNYCAENAPWTPIDGGATQYAPRFRINGLINTNNDCKKNIDSLLLSTAAWISYDVQTGLWRIIPKKAQSVTLSFNDDNITSGISLSSTRLEDLFNIVEAQYYDGKNKDQQAFSHISLFDSRPELLNYNEPENSYTLALEFCNNNIQAERIANMELEQSRDDLVVSFTTGHWGLQAQAGDVIAVENTVYGWVSPEFPGGKQFRVMRVREVEGDDGLLGAEITALEYNPLVYDDKNITEFYPRENIGIPNTGASNQLPPPSISIGNVDNTSSSPSFNLTFQIPETAGVINEIEIWYAEGDDYAGLGGDSTFYGQIGQAGGASNVLTVTGLPASNVGKQLYLNTPATGYSSEITSPAVALGAKITAFLTGNGGNGEYQLESDYQVPISRMSASLLRAKFYGYISNGQLNVTSVVFGTGNIGVDCLITGDGVNTGTVISGQVSGTTGGVGVYSLTVDGGTSQHPNLGSSGSPVLFLMRNPFPALNTYKLLTSVQPDAGKSSFTPGEIRSVAITGLPANAENKKYFLKSRSKSHTIFGDRYGPYSEIGTVDLEVPSVFWDPNSKNLTNQLIDLKKAILKLDFGKLVIPNNGLWLLKTMTAMDFGKMSGATPGPSPYQLDLGSLGFNPENEVDVDVITEDFVWQGDSYNSNYIPPTTVTPPDNNVEVPPTPSITYINPFPSGGSIYAIRRWENHPEGWYNQNNFEYITYYKGDAALLRWTFSWPTGYSSLGISAIEGYVRGRLYDIDTYSGGDKVYANPEHFQRYDYDTNTWVNLTDCSNIPIRMTQAPSTSGLAASVSCGFLKIRYNPATWPTGPSMKTFAFDTVGPTGLEGGPLKTPEQISWKKPV